eukprot:2897797-Amphidinium_carterae.1
MFGTPLAFWCDPVWIKVGLGTKRKHEGCERHLRVSLRASLSFLLLWHTTSADFGQHHIPNGVSQTGVKFTVGLNGASGFGDRAQTVLEASAESQLFSHASASDILQRRAHINSLVPKSDVMARVLLLS